MKTHYLISDIKNLNHKNIYYFDNNSTTLIYDDDIKCSILNWMSCGNPSNTLHDFGKIARNKIEECRHKIARDLHIEPSEFFFTSGATESNNIVIQGIFRHYIEKYPKQKFTAITSSFEHPSVINVFKHFEPYDNFEVIYVKPQTENNISHILPEDIEKAIKCAKHTIIILSIMHANNETGAIQNVREIGRIAKNNNIFFHSDVTQSINKFIIHPKEYNMDAISFSAHKFHGPKGVGGLYINKTCHDFNLCYGGEQEHKIRPGTENVAYIVGLTKAFLEMHKNRDQKNIKMDQLKKFIIDSLSKQINIEVKSPSKHCLPNTMLILFKDIKCNKDIVRELNKKKIYVSVGSACQTSSKRPSHVLESIGVYDKKDKIKIMRISISDYTTLNECKYLVNNLVKVINNHIKNHIKKY